jgi:ribose/xylose/arabinose/galactoside ABC-type transport system permease subunit
MANMIDSVNATKPSVTKIVNQLRMLLVLIGLVVVFAIFVPYFWSAKNFSAIGLTISVIGIVCIGQSFALLTGDFDLSVGSVASFCGIVVAILTKTYGMYPLMFVAGIALGALIGLVNGLLISKAKVNALITTLGMMTALQGGTWLVSNGFTVGVNTPQFRFLGTTLVAGIPLPVIILVVLYAVFYLVLRFTVFGRKVYSVGGNPEAARLSGINVDRVKILVFILLGVLSSFGGILLASRLGSANTQAGIQYPLNSIGACVLGGIAISGGVGNLFGALIGVAIIGVLGNGLIMAGIPSYWQWVANGFVLILAVYLDTRRRR